MYCTVVLILLVSLCYNVPHNIRFFVLMHVDLGTHLLQNIVDPLHQNRNYIDPFIRHCCSHQLISSQTSGICKISFFLLTRQTS